MDMLTDHLGSAGDIFTIDDTLNRRYHKMSPAEQQALVHGLTHFAAIPPEHRRAKFTRYKQADALYGVIGMGGIKARRQWRILATELADGRWLILDMQPRRQQKLRGGRLFSGEANRP